MKLNLKSIEAKNFFSIGSKSIKLNFQPGLNAIKGYAVGESTNNGIGKSTIAADAVVACIFGKSIRGLNQSEMINSINGCESELTLKLDVNDVPYRIERGWKPNYLRLINEIDESNGVKTLELTGPETQHKINELINVSLQSFINIVTLNINYSTPFFKMTPAQKREFLENILDLAVYGKMFDIVKKDFNISRANLSKLESEIKIRGKNLQEKIESFKNLQLLKEEFESSKQKNISTIQKNIESINDDLQKEIKEQSRLKPPTDLNDLKNKLNKVIEEISENKATIKLNIQEIEKNNKKINLLKSSPVCPLCGTETNSEHVSKELESMINETNKLQNSNIALSTAIEENENIKKHLIESINDSENQIKKIYKIEESIKNIKKLLQKEEQNLQFEQNKSFETKNIIDKKSIVSEKEEIEKLKSDYIETKKQFTLSEKMKAILGDQGIKTYAIRRLIPSLNKKMNEYLAMLSANYTLSFDVDLNETFKSRNRDVFKYENFSSGEQKRIDMAWTLSMIDISKNRNSIQCNLLVLDEILDSSMCINGIRSLVNYFKTQYKIKNPNSCTYVITHKSEIMADDFDRIITLRKENGFTHIDSIKEFEPIIQI